MPTGGTMELRIYCICGQKMKVSESMYGRPGKCVACRQKIRIPRLDEIPPDTNELYLKDHPELLRKVRKPAESTTAEPVTPEEAGEVVLSDERGEPVSVALDILEPLRNLCSMEHKIARKLAALDEYEGGASELQMREEFRGHQRRLERARMDLEEQLRQRLMEVAIELANTHEKIASAGLSVRVGEIGFQPFREKVDKLRRRRETLEKLQVNLRGWLACRDPHTAGGFVDLPVDSPSGERPRLNLPGEPDSLQPLIDRIVSALRQALFARERAERKLLETERLREEGAMSAAGLEEVRADCRAEKRRADAAVRFYRDRLEQIKSDFECDGQAVNAQLELARGRLQVGELTRPQFDQLESELLRAKTDLAKASDLLGRAMHANSVRDVPHPRGTFLGRLARPLGEPGIDVDSWIAWSASLILIVSTFLPAIGDQSALAVFRGLGTALPAAHWLLTVPILTAVLVALAALTPKRSVRGALMLVIGSIVCVAGSAALHETAYTANPVGDALRAHGLRRPGIVMFLLAAATMGVSGGYALSRVRGLWLAAPAAALAVSIALSAIFTDVWGLLLPIPRVTAAVQERPLTPGNESAAYPAVITVANVGRRALILATEEFNAANAYLFSVESRVGQESWRAVPQAAASSPAPTPQRPIATGSEMEFSYALPAGDYRAVLMPQAPGRSGVTALFSVNASQKIAVPADAAPEAGETVSPPAENGVAAQPEEPAGTIIKGGALYINLSMELRGLVMTAGRDPQFSVRVHLPDGSTRERSVSTGDNLYGNWSVKEFNPRDSSITVTNGEKIFILRTGERVDVDIKTQ